MASKWQEKWDYSRPAPIWTETITTSNGNRYTGEVSRNWMAGSGYLEGYRWRVVFETPYRPEARSGTKLMPEIAVANAVRVLEQYRKTR